jgi:hypothetical protein
MMKKLLIALGLSVLASAGVAQEDPLSPYKWTARPIVIFAESELDPRVGQQLRMLEARQNELDERDVVVIVIVDTDPDNALRQELRPRDFMFVLIGKDGEVKYRKPDPVSVREIVRLIDRMPLRLQELGQS